ncbi:hypothetical protein HanIR_Chr07g0312771 [Helianthus annuus]|nr:hypothetical protein HanIR_Chr07g0312771 [Helianthus annuus]
MVAVLCILRLTYLICFLSLLFHVSLSLCKSLNSDPKDEEIVEMKEVRDLGIFKLEEGSGCL